MVPKNILIFNQIALLLFVRLYEAFPASINIDASAIGLEAMPEDEGEEELWNSMQLATDSINWLEEAGFISVQSKTLDSNFDGVRLTQKGITLLGAPSSLDPDSESWGEKAQAVISRTAQDTATDLFKQLLVNAVKYVPAIFT